MAGPEELAKAGLAAYLPVERVDAWEEEGEEGQSEFGIVVFPV